MADCKRWVVTYTKHKNQKRKVYQDGTLELWTSGAKLVLLDECGGVLERRVLRKDEVVESGGMLEFSLHLVDIGELNGSCKPVSAVTVEGRDEKLIKKSEKLGIDIEDDKKTEVKHVGMQNFRPKFTQCPVRGNRQAGLHNIRVPQSHPSAAETSIKVFTEWDVLYTMHMTQKVKKYHDGMLRILSCGSQQKQALLYDDGGKLLNSRFLKSLEVIESGGTVSFDAHIVEIANTRDSSKFVTAAIDVQDKGNQKTGKPNVRTPQHCISMTAKETNVIEQQSVGAQQGTDREWNVLYTTHMTRKAKKYHDGLLRVSSCGSQQKKIMLYDDGGKLLNSRFLRKNEVVETGGTLAFDAQLVEVGDIKNNFKPQTFHFEVKEEFTIKDISEKYASSSTGSLDVTELRTAGWLSSNNSVRDVTQILSVLRRPASQELVSTKTSTSSHPSESLDLLEPVQLDDQLPVSQGSQSKRSLEANSEDRSLVITLEYGSFQAKTAHVLPDNYANLQNSSCGSDITKASNEKSDMRFTDKPTTDLAHLSQHLQGVESYSTSEKLQIESSLGVTFENDKAKTDSCMVLELDNSRKQILVEPQLNSGTYNCEASNSKEETFQGVQGLNEKSLFADDIPSFDLGF